MSMHRTAVAAVVAALSFTSFASAQDKAPATDKAPTTDNAPTDQPPKSDQTDVQGGQTPGTYREGTYDTTLPPISPPSSSSNAVGATRTTAAEYNETVGAEREKLIRPNRPMLITGGALFAAPYVAGVIVAAQSNLDADHRLYIPVVGPWLDLGQRPCSFGTGCSTGDNVASVFLIGSGVAQGAGVLLAAASLFVPEKTIERVEPKAAVHVTPVSFAGGGGVGAVGTF